jgi:hypothetical protein
MDEKGDGGLGSLGVVVIIAKIWMVGGKIRLREKCETMLTRGESKLVVH